MGVRVLPKLTVVQDGVVLAHGAKTQPPGMVLEDALCKPCERYCHATTCLGNTQSLLLVQGFSTTRLRAIRQHRTSL